MLDGVKKVTRGWSGYTEVNTVYYDAERVNVAQMVAALKKKETYIRTFFKPVFVDE